MDTESNNNIDNIDNIDNTDNIDNMDNIENTENNVGSQEILNAIDLGKITLNDKKKRGRPKKSQQLIIPPTNKIKINDVIFEQDEIILHLPISNTDIQSLDNNNKEIQENNNLLKDHTIINKETENNGDNQINENTVNTGLYDENEEKQYKILENNKQINIIKKYREENEKLKKYLLEITPMYFTEVKTYPSDIQIYTLDGKQYIPKKTDIPCWWCTYNFDWLPVGMAEYYHNSTFYVRGCFCSFNCKASYNLNINDNKVWDRYSLMKLMYYQINKDKITSIADIIINPAGPKELLIKYGGTMTIEEYRKNSKILGKEYHTLIPPFFPINTGFEECTNNKTNSKTMNIHNLLNPNSKDNILVKRNKPLKNVASKEIDDFIE